MFFPAISRKKSYFIEHKQVKSDIHTEDNRYRLNSKLRFLKKSLENKGQIKVEFLEVSRTPINGYSEGEHRRAVLNQEYRLQARKVILKSTRSLSPALGRTHYVVENVLSDVILEKVMVIRTKKYSN